LIFFLVRRIPSSRPQKIWILCWVYKLTVDRVFLRWGQIRIDDDFVELTFLQWPAVPLERE
jgi:hypothetical protein